MDRARKSSKASPLLMAVGPKDKENLASPDVALKCKIAAGGLKKKTFLKATSKHTNKNIEMIRNQMNNFHSDQATQKKEITAHDLTTIDNPGEAYWEQLSESRRVALESTWKENMTLHSRVMELEYENTKLKAMLAEAKTSITLLTELLEENESEGEGLDEQEEPQGEQSAFGHDDSLEDASFTSV